MLYMSEEELVIAISSLGDGTHQLKDIENQVIKDRHSKNKKKRKKK